MLYEMTVSFAAQYLLFVLTHGVVHPVPAKVIASPSAQLPAHGSDLLTQALQLPTNPSRRVLWSRSLLAASHSPCLLMLLAVKP